MKKKTITKGTLAGSLGLKPASTQAQKAWSKFPVSLKRELVKVLPDKDRDNVPNGFDCKPKNRRRQESFLPTDVTFLNKNTEIRVDKKLGKGGAGDVYSIKGNRHMVVKVPSGFEDMSLTDSQRENLIQRRKEGIVSEANVYHKLSLEQEPLFIPTKVVYVASNDPYSDGTVGLIRPKVMPVMDYANPVAPRSLKRLTDAQYENIRLKLIDLSRKGISIGDGLQIGFDYANRPLLYDLGYIERLPADIAFETNARQWKNFLRQTGKISQDWSNTAHVLSVYGEIN
jgi:hypothetical protein